MALGVGEGVRAWWWSRGCWLVRDSHPPQHAPTRTGPENWQCACSSVAVQDARWFGGAAACGAVVFQCPEAVSFCGLGKCGPPAAGRLFPAHTRPTGAFPPGSTALYPSGSCMQVVGMVCAAFGPSVPRPSRFAAWENEAARHSRTCARYPLADLLHFPWQNPIIATGLSHTSVGDGVRSGFPGVLRLADAMAHYSHSPAHYRCQF